MAKKGAQQPVKASKGGSVVMACGCKSSYQDEHYGHQNRVHNRSNSGPRCTVCGSVKK